MLYGVLLDRMSLSMKNRWFDEENRVYIIYQIGEIMEDLGFSKKKAMDLLQELETFGLLEKKRCGHGLPNILYVKTFMGGADDRGDLFGTSGGDDRECITDAAEQDCKDGTVRALYKHRHAWTCMCLMAGTSVLPGKQTVGSPKSLSACNRCTVSGCLIPEIFGEKTRLRSLHLEAVSQTVI